MKHFILGMVLMAFSSMAFALDQLPEDEPVLPKGKPFVIIADQIVDVQDDVADLQSQIDAILLNVTSLEDQVDALQAELASLETDVVANADAIALVNVRLTQAEADLLLKQNLVNGVCPDGQAVVSVNVGENDGQLVCSEVGGSVDLTYVHAYKWGSPSSANIGKVASCPAGYKATGGGGAWTAGIRSSSYHLNGAGWIAYGNKGSGAGFAMFSAYAVCIQ